MFRREMREQSRCPTNHVGEFLAAISQQLDAIIKTAEILITGYIPTKNDKKKKEKEEKNNNKKEDI